MVIVIIMRICVYPNLFLLMFCWCDDEEDEEELDVVAHNLELEVDEVEEL